MSTTLPLSPPLAAPKAPAWARPGLRIALYPGELLRVPRRRRRLHVIAGIAWISTDRRDILAPSGTCVDLPLARHPAIVSGVRSESLLFEVW